MNRVTVFLGILAIGLALLVFNHDSGTTFGIDNDDFGRIVYLLPISLMLAAGIWASRRTVSETLRNLFIWLVILLALATAYLYRYDALDAGNRLMAGLIPGRAFVVTTSEGGQEVILHKLLNGHFSADVMIDGHRINMLVDTGASLLALNQADARRIGLDPKTMNYSMTIMTANGRGRAAPVTLKSVGIGPIARHDVAAAVSEDGKLDQSLLGMSFLETLGSMQMQTDELRLRD
ncbi:retropepsin-like aspartic protease family protein [Rhizobium tumorigenes]|uniref:TIGR02281 family clan AA aspartic protease n=1 Tax=Rhizobium tumorigenes TaxID=2041385 RepID=A0AAF1KS55_9HYPH|nr:TIGR02281 family clan AA aspartic protease [Rhizobium tumorigenes]WFR97043.1 TIGR02281 family clan AA aspartic protease [Rhizobium tumorigenes]WFS02602.1 TIGR02281 family clan AA aspartic protease [Rhizobium tumorigenes]